MFCLGTLVFTANLDAQQQWTFELSGMVPYNVPLPLTIHQAGESDISVTARYFSEPFKTPICWVWQIARWTDQTSWELQAIHHKLYLENNPPEVESFSVSHGLNLVTVNRGWRLGEYVVRGGAGIVLAHPEGSIRGKSFSEDQGILGLGYYVSGPAFVVGGGKRFRLVGDLFRGLEAMSAISYADTPISDGDAHLYNVVFQVNLGLGYSIE
jgi:hypothetical protein